MQKSQENNDYTKFTELTFDAGRAKITVASKPGLPDWNRLLPAESLLIETIKPETETHTILLGCHHGAVTVHLARHQNAPDSLTAADTNSLALACTRRSLELNALTGVHLKSIYEVDPGWADRVIILPPRGRTQGRAWLAASTSLLKPGGLCYLAGANDEGIQSLIKDAASLLGSCEVLAYRKGSRVALSQRPENLLEPDWLQEPGIQPGTFHNQEIRLPDGHTVQIRSLPGVFSFEHLDPGSALLLAHLDGLIAGLPPKPNVLDVGCGYGILGLATARLAPEASISMVDIDLAAVACARLNLEANNLHNAQVYPSDLLDACANQRYHLILSNPPFHAGKQVRYEATHALIEQAQTHLSPGGSLVIVANRFIRYEKVMGAYFSDVEVLAETPQYHLLRASNQVPQGKPGRMKS